MALRASSDPPFIPPSVSGHALIPSELSDWFLLSRFGSFSCLLCRHKGQSSSGVTGRCQASGSVCRRDFHHLAVLCFVYLAKLSLCLQAATVSASSEFTAQDLREPILPRFYPSWVSFTHKKRHEGIGQGSVQSTPVECAAAASETSISIIYRGQRCAVIVPLKQ